MDETLDVRDDFKDGKESFKDPERRGRRHPEEPLSVGKKDILIVFHFYMLTVTVRAGGKLPKASKMLITAEMTTLLKK